MKGCEMQTPCNHQPIKRKINIMLTVDSPRWLLMDGCKMFQLTLPWTRPCKLTRLYFLGDYACYIMLRHHCVYITCTFDHMFSLNEAQAVELKGFWLSERCSQLPQR